MLHYLFIYLFKNDSYHFQCLVCLSCLNFITAYEKFVVQSKKEGRDILTFV